MCWYEQQKDIYRKINPRTRLRYSYYLFRVSYFKTMKSQKAFFRKIYQTHPQGKGIFTFDFFVKKFSDELHEAFLFLNE